MELRSKEKLAWYSALCLILSYAEMLLPRFLPFLRLGLANSIILLSLGFDFSDFFLLLIFKSIAVSFISGTLFSPFFIISFLQSLFAGLLMYLMNKFLKRVFSVYGISIAGAGLSSVIQIFLAALYLGKEVYSVLWIMLIFSIFSGFITALLSEKIFIRKEPPQIDLKCIKKSTETTKNNPYLSIIFIILIIILAFLTKNLIFLTLMLLISLIFQLLFKRKLMLLPHLYLWLFIIILNLINGEGKILFKAGFLTIYENSLLEGVSKAIKLSIVIAVSQGAGVLKPQSNSILSLTLMYFYGLSVSFNSQKGNIIKKINSALHTDKLPVFNAKAEKNSNIRILFFIELIIFALLFFCDFYFRKIT